MNRKKIKSRRKITSPMVDSPGKRLGAMASTRATPLVDMVTVYHAKVKWRRRSRQGMLGWRKVGTRSRTMNEEVCEPRRSEGNCGAGAGEGIGGAGCIGA